MYGGWQLLSPMFASHTQIQVMWILCTTLQTATISMWTWEYIFREMGRRLTWRTKVNKTLQLNLDIQSHLLYSSFAAVEIWNANTMQANHAQKWCLLSFWTYQSRGQIKWGMSFSVLDLFFHSSQEVGVSLEKQDAIENPYITSQTIAILYYS